jgi:hypothetical protein
MAYGYQSSYAFKLPQEQNVPTPQDLVTRGLEAEQELYGGQPQAVFPEAPSELEFVDGVTEDAYKKWGDLKSFAQTMWHNYRIDVSRPDARNPISLRAHQAYKKGLADVQYTLDMLKQGRKTQMLDEAAAREGRITMNDRQDGMPSSMVDSQERFTSTAINPATQQQNLQSMRDYYTDREFQQAMSQYLAKKAQFQLFAAQDPRNAEYWRRQEASLVAPVRSTKLFAPTGGGSGVPDLMPAINELSQIRSLLINGDVAGVTRLTNKDITRISRERGPDGMKVNVYYKGGGKDTIDLNGSFGGLDQINELRNANISSDRRIDTRQIMPFIQQMVQDPSFQQYNNPTDAFQLKYLTEGLKYWNTKPKNISTIEIDGVNISNKQEFINEVKGAIDGALKGGRLYMPNSTELVDKFEVDDDVVTIASIDEARSEAMPTVIQYDLTNPKHVNALQRWLGENSDELFVNLSQAVAPVEDAEPFQNGYTVKGRGATFQGTPMQTEQSEDPEMEAAKAYIRELKQRMTEKR